MKTTVYAVRDGNGTRLTYRYRDIKEARQAKTIMQYRSGATDLEVYRTTQDLPPINRRHTW